MEKAQDAKNLKKVLNFYRYKINTKNELITEFEELRAQKSPSNKKTPPGVKNRFLAANVILHSKYNNKQVIAFKFTATVLKKLGYSDELIKELVGHDNFLGDKESSLSMSNVSKRNNSMRNSSVRNSSRSRRNSIKSSRENSQVRSMRNSMLNFDKWKSKNPGRFFIVDDKFYVLKKELLARGWKECENKESRHFDFRFTSKKEAFSDLHENQLVNHNVKFEKITLAFYLYTLLKILINEDINADVFFPRCYDLKCYRDHANFINDYKLGQCVTTLNLFVLLERLNDVIIFKALISIYGIMNYLDLQYDSKSMKEIISNRDLALLCQPPTQSLWLLSDADKDQQKRYSDRIGIHPETHKSSGEYIYALKKKAQAVLLRYKQEHPQYDLLHSQNAWILKSYRDDIGFTSRIYKDYKDILGLLLDVKEEIIAQKYIERPLLVNNYKFMLKAWMVVHAAKPLTLWLYSDYYLKFTSKEYDLDALGDPFVHLTSSSLLNNDPMKSQHGFSSGHVWTKSRYRAYQRERLGQSPEQIKDQETQLKKIAVSVVKANLAEAKKMRNSVVVLGLDVIVDVSYRLWLCKVNPVSAVNRQTVG